MYPYLVIRWMAAVYGRLPIEFIDEGESKLTKEKLLVYFPNAYKDGLLRIEAMDAAVGVISDEVVKRRFRMCLVLSETDCYFIEPDGSINHSTEPPSGGIRIDHVEVPER